MTFLCGFGNRAHRLGAVRLWQGPQVLTLALAQGITSFGHSLEGMLPNPVTQWQAICHLLLLALQLVDLCVNVYVYDRKLYSVSK